MSNGQDTQATPTTADKIKAGGKAAEDMGKTIELLFGPADPSSPSYVPSHVGSAPPQLATPFGGSGGFNPSGAGGGPMPSPQGMPTSTGPATPPGIMRTGTEFRTSQGKNAAVTGGAIENISNAMIKFADQKNKSGLEHAKFLYDIVKTSYEGEGENSPTANLILKDDKNRKAIEKYITGALPRIPDVAVAPGGAPQGGQPQGGQPGAPGGAPGGQPPQGQPQGQPQPPQQRGGINQPGGFAFPRPSQEQQMKAALNNKLIEGLKNNDPRVLAHFFGPESTLSNEEFAHATKAKFGIELPRAQVEMLSIQSKTAMATAQVDMLKYLAGQEEMTKRAVQVAGMHGESAQAVARINAEAKLASMRMYSQALKDIKGSPGDKMEGIIYKSLADTYNHLAVATAQAAGRLAKDNPEQAKLFEQQSKEWAEKAKGMENYHDANQYYKKYIEGGDAAVEEDETLPEKPTEEEPD